MRQIDKHKILAIAKKKEKRKKIRSTDKPTTWNTKKKYSNVMNENINEIVNKHAHNKIERETENTNKKTTQRFQN